MKNVKTRKLTLNKTTLKGIEKADLARVSGGATSRTTTDPTPPQSHTCATCTSQCKTMIVCCGE